MEYARLETAKLRDIDDTYYYGAQCRGCGHGARLSVTKLIARLGDDYPLTKVRERLRCERCHSRAVVITFLAPNQRTGNLVELFTRTRRLTADGLETQPPPPHKRLLPSTDPPEWKDR